MKKILYILVCTFLLSACAIPKIVPEDEVKANNSKKSISENDKIKENVIMLDTSFQIDEKYRNSISLMAVKGKNYYFSYETDKAWCYAKYCDGKMSGIYSLDSELPII